MSRKTALNVSIQFKLGERSQESLILVKVIITKIEVMGISANKRRIYPVVRRCFAVLSENAAG